MIARFNRAHDRLIIRLAKSPLASKLPTVPEWVLWAVQFSLVAGIALTLYTQFRFGL
ncbi:hypothetical protein ABIB06_006592 [Bradyrhizobium sp. LB8.2]